jgi:hypothetical protein
MDVVPENLGGTLGSTIPRPFPPFSSARWGSDQGQIAEVETSADRCCRNGTMYTVQHFKLWPRSVTSHASCAETQSSRSF